MNQKVSFTRRAPEIPEGQKFCLYGFRTGVIWKKVISATYLIFCMIMLVSILAQKRFDPLPKRDHWVNVIQNGIMLIFFYSPYIFLSASGLRRHLPLLKKNQYHKDAIALILICVILFLSFLMVNNLHTPEYFADQENHAYELVETKEPGCKEIGEHIYECSFCGREYYENISAIGHDYVQTQLSDGSTVWVCSRCEDIRTEAP